MDINIFSQKIDPPDRRAQTPFYLKSISKLKPIKFSKIFPSILSHKRVKGIRDERKEQGGGARGAWKIARWVAGYPSPSILVRATWSVPPTAGSCVVSGLQLRVAQWPGVVEGRGGWLIEPHPTTSSRWPSWTALSLLPPPPPLARDYANKTPRQPKNASPWKPPETEKLKSPQADCRSGRWQWRWSVAVAWKCALPQRHCNKNGTNKQIIMIKI